jgi:hemerythrin
MKPIEWIDAFSMGDPEIDRQHRHFISQANALSAAVADDADRPTLLRMTEEIATDAAFHFLYEDRVLLALGYGDAESHIAEHRRLERRIGDILGHFRAAEESSAAAAAAMAEEIRNLLLDHLLYYDLKYKSHLQFSAR